MFGWLHSGQVSHSGRSQTHHVYDDADVPHQTPWLCKTAILYCQVGLLFHWESTSSLAEHLQFLHSSSRLCCLASRRAVGYPYEYSLEPQNHGLELLFRWFANRYLQIAITHKYIYCVQCMHINTCRCIDVYNTYDNSELQPWNYKRKLCTCSS